MIELPVINCLEPKCGACCMEQAFLPVSWWSSGAFGEADPNTLPEGLRVSLDVDRKRLMAGTVDAEGPCIWFDLATRQCKHYEFRPDVCKEEVIAGDEACLSWRKDYPPVRVGPTQ